MSRASQLDQPVVRVSKSSAEKCPDVIGVYELSITHISRGDCRTDLDVGEA